MVGLGFISFPPLARPSPDWKIGVKKERRKKLLQQCLLFFRDNLFSKDHHLRAQPDFLISLIGVLIRFGTFYSDVTKMFHQVRVLFKDSLSFATNWGIHGTLTRSLEHFKCCHTSSARHHSRHDAPGLSDKQKRIHQVLGC